MITPRAVVSALVVAVLGLPLLAGCTPAEEARGRLSGTVQFHGKPLSGGFVVFQSDDGTKTDRATVNPDGTYSSDRVPLGSGKVGVEPVQKGLTEQMPKYAKKGIPPDAKLPEAYNKAANSAGTYVDIPAKLRDPKTSGITYSVAQGEAKTLDITLPNAK